MFLFVYLPVKSSKCNVFQRYNVGRTQVYIGDLHKLVGNSVDSINSPLPKGAKF